MRLDLGSLYPVAGSLHVCGRSVEMLCKTISETLRPKLYGMSIKETINSVALSKIWGFEVLNEDQQKAIWECINIGIAMCFL